MAHARQAERPVLVIPVFPFLAAIAAIIIAGVLVFFALDPLGLRQPDTATVSPHVLASARQWEIERLAQSGYIEPSVRSAREWEKQRQQQSPFN